MSTNFLGNSVGCFQSGEKDSMLNLLEVFSPLIKNLAFQLQYEQEDAKQDIICDFIEIITQLNLTEFDDPSDAFLVSYISIALFHRFVDHTRGQKKHKCCVAMSSLNEIEQLKAEVNNAKYDQYDGCLKSEIRKLLNEYEFCIIDRNLFGGESIQSIASSMKISRQSVNQTRRRALNKLKQAWA